MLKTRQHVNMFAFDSLNDFVLTKTRVPRYMRLYAQPLIRHYTISRVPVRNIVTEYTSMGRIGLKST